MSLLLLLAGTGETILHPGDTDTPGVVLEAAFGYTWQDTNKVWTDLTSYIAWDQSNISINRGRSDELQPFGTGTATVVLENHNREFDPTHSGSPFNGNLRPLVPIRISSAFNGVLYRLFYGFAEGWPQAYTVGDHLAYTELVVNDAFELFASGDLVSNFWTVEHPTLGIIDSDNRIAGEGGAIEAELSGARMDRLADLAGWPSTLRDFDAGVSMMNSTFPTGSPLEAFQGVEAAENGAVFIDRNGNLVFRDRHAYIGATSQGTFSDEDLDLPYADLKFTYDRRYIYNDVLRQAENGVARSATDATSIARYFRRRHEYTGLGLTSDADAYSLATWFLARYKEPQLRAEPITVDPYNNVTTLFPQVLARDLLDRITVVRTPQQTGTAITKQLHIEQVTHDIGLHTWRTTWALSPADENTYWTVEHPTLGVIDSTNLISA